MTRSPEFTIFLSASVPSKERSQEYLRVPNAQRNVEEAIISICRSIFANGGSVVFGGHPTISPMVAMVATEFDWKGKGYVPVIIYQSDAFQAHIAEATAQLERLGTAEIKWIGKAKHEVYNSEKKGPQCPESLEIMRNKMISCALDAMICVGGMEGVEIEFKKFLEMHKDKIVYLLPFTGGAAYNLSNQRYENRKVEVFNYSPLSITENGETRSLHMYPYPTIAERIIRFVKRNKEQKRD